MIITITTSPGYRFEAGIIINVFVSSVRFILIPMLQVYAIINSFNLTVRGSTVDVRL